MTDLTDGDSGLNLVIDIKNGFHAEAVLENLFKLTPMEESVNINAVALVEGQPQTLGLLTLLHVFIDHRLEVVRRRSLFRRTKAQDRLHLVAGLLTAILDIDEVIQLIRESDDAAAAKARLIEVFDLSEVQSSYILEMPLRRLTKFSRIELEKESDVLKREIEELTKILDNDSELRALVSDELAAIAQAHATPRRTLLMEAGAAPISAAVPLEVDDEPCVVLMSSTGLLARTADQRFEQVGDIARANHDVIISAVPATNRGFIGLVTSTGTLIRLSVVDLPALPSVIGIPALSAGAPIGAFVDLPLGESALCLTTLDETGGIALATANGVVKRVLPDGLTNKDSWEIIRLDEGDQVVGAIGLDEAAAETSELVFVTSDGQLLRFAASAVRPQGRAAGGMAGVRLAPGARVTSFTALTPAASAVVVTIAGSADALPGTDAGSIKITPLAEYPAKGRGTGGVRCHKFRSGEDTLVLAWVGIGPARAATASGVPADLPTVLGKRDGTGSPGTTPISGLGGQL